MHQKENHHFPGTMYRFVSFLLIITLFHVTTCYDFSHQWDNTNFGFELPTKKAIVRLQGPTVNGNVTFSQYYWGGKVTIEGNITGLTTGKYGFHIHAKGDITGGCASTGPHYNPYNVSHGAPDDDVRHVGDLGNIVTDENNVTQFTMEDFEITLLGEHSIIGRGVVVHGREDDLGKTDHVDSKTTGNAGPRVACGVIGIK